MHRRARGDSATGLASRTIAVAVPDKGNYCMHELAESKNPRAPLGNPQPGCQQERAAYKPRLSITLGCRRRGARAAAPPCPPALQKLKELDLAQANYKKVKDALAAYEAIAV